MNQVTIATNENAQQNRSVLPLTRQRFCWILVLLGTVMQLARILSVHSATGETPFLSANDRSRWCTILSLSVQSSYVIDDVIEIKHPVKPFRRTWYSIDMVQHRGRDGKQHFYSSKPPILATLYAGVYWAVRKMTGKSLIQDTFFVARCMLILVNLLPLVLLWWIMLRWADRYCVGDFHFAVCSVFAVFGTFLSTFSNTINNHLPGALSMAVSLWTIERIALIGDGRRRWYVLAGFASSYLVANELPGLLWVFMAAGLLALCDWKKVVSAYWPAMIPIVAMFFLTNYLAHDTWRPAYSQRAVGSLMVVWEHELPEDLGQLRPSEIAEQLKSQGIELSDQAQISKGRREGVWEIWDEMTQWRIALRAIDRNHLGIYQWGDWYDYPGSYWVEGRKKGVDVGEPSRWKYAFHCLLGHHGILSLTPFWIVSLIGVVVLFRSARSQSMQDRMQRALVVAIVTTTLIVLGFYVSRPLEDRNYGGVCCGLRWSFWLIPLWYWTALRGVNLFTGFWSKIAVGVLLIASIFSAVYPWNNPWTSPWIYQWTLHQGQEY